MSHADPSPLSGYNSLQDPHLRGYFSNGRMRKHLRKAGLVTRSGVIVSEQDYRLKNARREHKKHVRDLMAQAIVHKTLDMERYRQVEIRKKLEEIAKMELVRKIKNERDRRGDEDVLPFLSPRRPASGRSRPMSSASSKGLRKRPKSAPGTSEDRPHAPLGYSAVKDEDGVMVYMDAEGKLHDGPGYPNEQIDSKHLYGLNRKAMRDYHLAVNLQGGGGRDRSPYTIPQSPLFAPEPPPSRRPPTGTRRVRSASYSLLPARSQSARRRAPLHRDEPAMSHATPIHSNAVMRFKYRVANKKFKSEAEDPRVEIIVEQQHCGGNTLTVFKELVYPNEEFEFVSKRHRGYPLGLTLYINGRSEIVISSCCERKHRVGTKLGQFMLTGVDGVPPCYKCKILKDLRAKDRRRRASEKHRKNHHNPDVIVQVGDDKEDKTAAADNYEDDFENDDNSDKSSRSSSRSSRASSRASSRTSSRSSDRRSPARSATPEPVRTPTPPKAASPREKTPSPVRERTPSPVRAKTPSPPPKAAVKAFESSSDEDTESTQPPRRAAARKKTDDYSSSFESSEDDRPGKTNDSRKEKKEPQEEKPEAIVEVDYSSDSSSDESSSSKKSAASKTSSNRSNESTEKSRPRLYNPDDDVMRWCRLWEEALVPTYIREMAETQTVVNVSDRPLTDKEVDLLCAVLYNEQCCEQLTLRNNQLTDPSVRLISKLLRHLQPDVKFTSLNLSGNGTVTPGCVQHIIDLLSNRPGIEELLLADTGIGATGVQELLKYLIAAEQRAKERRESELKNTSRKLVRDVKREVHQEAAVDAGAYVTDVQNSDVESLSSGSEASPEVPVARESRLQSLSLRGAGLTDDELRLIARYLTSLPAVHTLNLSSAPATTPSGWRQLLETLASLREYSRLMHLVLDDNRGVDDTCLMALMMCVRFCSSLQTLSLEGSSLGTESRAALHRAETQSGGVLLVLEHN